MDILLLKFYCKSEMLNLKLLTGKKRIFTFLLLSHEYDIKISLLFIIHFYFNKETFSRYENDVDNCFFNLWNINSTSQVFIHILQKSGWQVYLSQKLFLLESRCMVQYILPFLLIMIMWAQCIILLCSVRSYIGDHSFYREFNKGMITFYGSI